MESWLLAYSNSFLRTDKLLLNYLTTRKDSRIWMGTIEVLLALCLIRFRPQAKFKIKSCFEIGTDHSHPFKIGEYQFNFQGLKRAVFGGNSNDLLNFKTPLFYSESILDQLRPENKAILVKIARESVQSLLDTYKKDILAIETLQSIDMILKTLQQEDGNLEALKGFLYINEDYIKSPLSQKNIELWEANIDILNKISVLYNDAYIEVHEGKNPEKIIAEIKGLQESIRLQLEEYLMEIPKGH